VKNHSQEKNFSNTILQQKVAAISILLLKDREESKHTGEGKDGRGTM